MRRAILVEDEEFVRAELAELFPWRQYGFTLVGEAENAEAAMALIAETNPNLVITDIRMPEMDGLGLIAWIVRHYPNIVVVVVSAYNDFPYVRKALRLGASDYLIKAEITSETAGALLKRISRILTERRFVYERQKELADHVEHYRLLVHEAFWRDLLTGNVDKRQLPTRASQVGLDLENYWFGLIFIHVAKDSGLKEVEKKICEELEEEIREIPVWKWCWHIVRINQDDFVIILSQDGRRPDEREVGQIAEVAYHLGVNATITLTISVSSNICKFSALAGSFREVKEVNLLRLYHPEKRYITVKDLSSIRQAPPPDIPRLLNAWERVLRGVHSPSQGTVSAFLDDVFVNIIPTSLTPKEARWLVLDLIHTLHWVLFDYRVRWEDLVGPEQYYLDAIDEADSIDDWLSMIKDLVVRYLQFIKAQKRGKVTGHTQTSLAIRKALAFIQANYSKDLSLEEVAAHAGVSMSYLSRVFPEYVGDNFCNYLRHLRIERAKELLLFTNDYIYEIATKVGFWNSRYFSKIFHEEVGMTPVAYRRSPKSGPNEKTMAEVGKR